MASLALVLGKSLLAPKLLSKKVISDKILSLNTVKSNAQHPLFQILTRPRIICHKIRWFKIRGFKIRGSKIRWFKTCYCFHFQLNQIIYYFKKWIWNFQTAKNKFAFLQNIIKNVHVKLFLVSIKVIHISQVSTINNSNSM